MKGKKWKILLIAGLVCVFPLTVSAALPLKVRDVDAQVRPIEEMLSGLGYEIRWIDEEYGYETMRAVKAFQVAENLPSTGVVDQRTFERLENAAKKTGKAGDEFAANEAFRVWDKDPRIKDLEGQLVAMGYNVKWVDEEFGFETERAIKAFQKDRKMAETGVVDKATWEALWGRGGPVPAGQTDVAAIRAQRVAQEARRHIGTPYVWGGDLPSGFDCSGYIQYVFNQSGYSLPRMADEQYGSGQSVGRAGLRQGDIVFFETYEPGPSHNGIYLGSGQFIHASSSRGVMISSLDEIYWAPRYVGARRIIK